MCFKLVEMPLRASANERISSSSAKGGGAMAMVSDNGVVQAVGVPGIRSSEVAGVESGLDDG